MELIGKQFVLFRKEDISGVSGVGIVCWGFQFADGKCATRWCSGETRQTAVWDSIEDIERIHGHNGSTVVLFPTDEHLSLLQELYDFLPRFSCKSQEPDGCIVCRTREFLVRHGGKQP